MSKYLYQLINNLQDNIKKTKLLSLIGEVSDLPSEYQEKFFMKLINIIHNLQKEYYKELDLNECKKYGHIYTPWKEIKYERQREIQKLEKKIVYIKNNKIIIN